MNFLDEVGLKLLWTKIKSLIPTKVSQLNNDLGYVISTDTSYTYISVKEVLRCADMVYFGAPPSSGEIPNSYYGGKYTIITSTSSNIIDISKIYARMREGDVVDVMDIGSGQSVTLICYSGDNGLIDITAEGKYNEMYYTFKNFVRCIKGKDCLYLINIC